MLFPLTTFTAVVLLGIIIRMCLLHWKDNSERMNSLHCAGLYIAILNITYSYTQIMFSLDQTVARQTLCQMWILAPGGVLVTESGKTMPM